MTEAAGRLFKRAAPAPPQDDPVTKILDFLQAAERLKKELRHSWLSDGRQESVAEHSWQACLLALLLHDHLEYKVDISRVLEMLIVHDLGEVVAGDQPYFEIVERDRHEKTERLAVEELARQLPSTSVRRVLQLWEEFAHGRTREALFARAVDDIEVQIQHNMAAIQTWVPQEAGLIRTKVARHCAHDDFLQRFAERVQEQAEAKWAGSPSGELTGH